MTKGGKREGAGRKPLPPGKAKVGILVKLPPWLIRWMDDRAASRAVLIEEAMTNHFEISKPD